MRDIDTVTVDSLKALTPIGRLEKWTWLHFAFATNKRHADESGASPDARH